MPCTIAIGRVFIQLYLDDFVIKYINLVKKDYNNFDCS